MYNITEVESPPFEIEAYGWGEFEMKIRIIFTDATEKPLEVSHLLKLTIRNVYMYYSHDTEDENGNPMHTKKPLVSEHRNDVSRVLSLL